MTSLQRRVTVGSAICGTILALIVFIADATGMLQNLEWYLYDLRAETCQYFTPPPAQQVVHLDIDDAAIDVIGRWPWSRSTWGTLLDEISLAKPKVVGIDVLFSDPQPDEIIKAADGSYQTVINDPALADAVKKLNCVVLPDSFSFGNERDVDVSIAKAGAAELSYHLSLSPAELTSRLVDKGFTQHDLAARVDAQFIDIRDEAVAQAIERQLLVKRMSVDQIKHALLPTNPATTQLALQKNYKPLTEVIEEQYPHVLAKMSLRRFALTPPLGLSLPPPDGQMNQVPLPQVSDVITGNGFADYNIFSEPVVRAVPLFIRSDNRFYPQFAFAVACKMLDADVGKARLEDHAVTIDCPTGAIRIPVRSRYSAVAGRDLGFLMDIPWFGTNDWRTMYDWPQHRDIVRHYTMNVVWSIHESQDRIAHNNVEIDTAMQPLIAVLGSDYDLKNLAGDDYAARRKNALRAMDDMKSSGYAKVFPDQPVASLDADEKVLHDSLSNLMAALSQNDKLLNDIADSRKDLAAKIGGKAIFIGSVATASGDVVTTSLHPRCPGVVVHGVIVSDIINRYFLHTAPRWLTLLLTLFFGLLATALTSRMPPLHAVLLLILIAIAYFVANGLLLFGRWNVIVNAAAPLLAIGICWGGCVVVRLILEGVERIRLHREAAVIQHEISLARQVQASLIPKELAILQSVESYGWTLAATTTGGDCFDLWKLSDGRLGILVADASGHGLGPSIIVSEVRALVRALCDIYSDPQKLLDKVNARLAADLQGSKFCTCFLGFLSEDGKMSWGSAGHGPMLWCATRDGEPHELEGTGLPLGVSDEWFGDEHVPVLDLEVGGWLMAISDGIFEQAAPGGEQFGVDRVKQIIKDSPTENCEQLCAKLREAVHRWQVVKEPNDDQTIVIVRRQAATTTGVSFVQPTDMSESAPEKVQ